VRASRKKPSRILASSPPPACCLPACSARRLRSLVAFLFYFAMRVASDFARRSGWCAGGRRSRAAQAAPRDRLDHRCAGLWQDDVHEAAHGRCSRRHGQPSALATVEARHHVPARSRAAASNRSAVILLPPVCVAPGHQPLRPQPSIHGARLAPCYYPSDATLPHDLLTLHVSLSLLTGTTGNGARATGALAGIWLP
jgi:hypothetical protein